MEYELLLVGLDVLLLKKAAFGHLVFNRFPSLTKESVGRALLLCLAADAVIAAAIAGESQRAVSPISRGASPAALGCRSVPIPAAAEAAAFMLRAAGDFAVFFLALAASTRHPGRAPAAPASEAVEPRRLLVAVLGSSLSKVRAQRVAVTPEARPTPHPSPQRAHAHSVRSPRCVAHSP